MDEISIWRHIAVVNMCQTADWNKRVELLNYVV